MILTCPQCNTHFELADHLIGEKGKKVRCSACAHVWLQKPVTAGGGESLLGSDKDDPAAGQTKAQARADTPVKTSSIEAALSKPVDKNGGDSHDGDNDVSQTPVRAAGVKLSPPKTALGVNNSYKTKLYSLANNAALRLEAKPKLAILVLTSLFLLLACTLSVLFQKPITKLMPFMHGYYDGLGAQSTFSAKNIAINNLKAVVDEGGTVLKISADLVNLAATTSQTLPIAIEQLDNKGDVIGRKIVLLDKTAMKAGELFSFAHATELAEGAQHFKLSFVLANSAGTETSHSSSYSAKHMGHNDNEAANENTLLTTDFKKKPKH